MTSQLRIHRLVADPPAGLSPLPIDPADFQTVPDSQNWHVAFSDPDLGLNVGVWDTTAMQEALGPYPGDEFIFVLEGAFEMRDASGAGVPAKAGQCVLFRNGAPLSWTQQGYLRKLFLLYDDPRAARPGSEPAEGAVTTHETTAELTQADQVPDSPTQERDRELFRNAHGNMTAGLWDTGPFTSEMGPFPHHELCHVTGGEAILTEPDGTAHTFRAGDTFFIPKGANCAWHVTEYMKKYYVILDPSIRPQG